MWSSLARWLPLLAVVQHYDRRLAGRDLLGAVLVSLLLVPQALAYAQLAGLPPASGVYASILPLLAYALFGSSPGVALAVGPVAILALMSASALGPNFVVGSSEYQAAALLLTLLVGLILLAMSLLRLGFLANFLSHPVIAGFVSGSALLIALSQVRHVLGVGGGGQTVPALLLSLQAELGHVHAPTVLVGVGSLLLLMLLRGPLPLVLQRLAMPSGWVQVLKSLAPLLVLLAAMLVVYLFDLEGRGVKVVGALPVLLPTLQWPQLDMVLARQLLPAALLIALVGFVESASIAQSMAARQRRSINPDRELAGQAAANLTAALSGGMPVSASFSRSALALESGAATPMVGVWCAAFMLLAALGLAPLLAHLPQAVLAASILLAVLGLVDVRGVWRTWRFAWQDGLAQAATLFGVLLLGVEVGILLGVGLSLLLFLWRTSRPHMAVVGQLPGTEHFRNVQRFAVIESASVLSLRVDESLYFPNARYLEERIASLIAERPQVRHLVLMCSGVNLIDASALGSLETIAERLLAVGMQLHLSEVKGPVMDQLKRSDFLQNFGGQVFVSQYQALFELDRASTTRVA